MKDIFSGKTVLFQGDSVTDCDRSRENDDYLGTGYPALVAADYYRDFPQSTVKFVNRAVSGDRSIDLLRRYERDFADVHPDFVSILIGINDTWRAFDSHDPTSAEQFQSNYFTLIQNIRRDMPQAKICLIEPFLLHPGTDISDWRPDLDAKVDVVKSLAKNYADYYIPMEGIFYNAIASGKGPVTERTLKFSSDGVHPQPDGHALIAKTWAGFVWKHI
jgi:lysophospholipase L1-like esterase